MKRSVSRIALLYAVLTGMWILGLDLLSDTLATERPHFVQLHAVIAIFTVLLLYLLLVRELRARERVEKALHQARDELELRVQESTEELRIANQELQAEIATRAQAEAERETLLIQVEQERRRVEELAGALARERDMLQVIMENTPAQLVYLDPDFNFVRFNTPYVEGTGHTREELMAQNHFELFPNRENQAIFERVRDTGEPVAFHAKPFEYADQPERGTTYWDWTLVPVKDQGGQVQGLVFSLIDVTERKRTEEALREQARALATMEERQRLARDLHDVVSQTLFSASLSAEILPCLWERDPEEGRRCLEEVHHLTRSALAEMRTLLLELRPGALVETPLSELLGQLVEAVGRRARLPVSLLAEQIGPLPADVQVAAYRIAQEALNNVVKHSDASQAEVRLGSVQILRSTGEDEEANGLELCVCDDGCGFNPEKVSPQHLGLGIMRERAEAIGAELTINTLAGHGTQVGLAWPRAQGEER